MNLERQVKIKDEYIKLILDIISDYDGYYDVETKKSDVEGLTSLINETVEVLQLALNNDDKKIMFENVSTSKKYNILYEEIS